MIAVLFVFFLSFFLSLIVNFLWLPSFMFVCSFVRCFLETIYYFEMSVSQLKFDLPRSYPLARSLEKEFSLNKKLEEERGM